MEWSRVYYSRNESYGEIEHFYYFIHVWNLKQQNKWRSGVKQKQSQIQRRIMCLPERRRIWRLKNRWWRIWGANFQLQNKWVSGMKCIVWGNSQYQYNILVWWQVITRLNSDDHLGLYRTIESPCCRSVILQKHTKD